MRRTKPPLDGLREGAVLVMLPLHLVAADRIREYLGALSHHVVNLRVPFSCVCEA